MAKRKGKRRREASLGDVAQVVKSPKIVYRCLECNTEGHPRDVLVTATVGDHEIPNGRVVPGDVVVRAPVCGNCYKERMKGDGS